MHKWDMITRHNGVHSASIASIAAFTTSAEEEQMDVEEEEDQEQGPESKNQQTHKEGNTRSSTTGGAAYTPTVDRATTRTKLPSHHWLLTAGNDQRAQLLLNQ